MAAMRTCPSCGEPCAHWRTECPGCGAAFVVRETRKVPVIEEDRGELQQLVDALEQGRPAPPPAARVSARSVTITRDVAVAPRPRSAPTRAGFGWGRVVLAVAAVALVLLGIAVYPLQTIAACAVLFVLSGCYYIVVVRR
jgi:anti-sigma-K factor RskA